MFRVSGRREMFIFDTPLARLDEDNRYKFLVFVPKDENNFSVDNINVEDINYFTGMQYRLDAKFPKFEFNKDMDLTKIIKSLGIERLFSNFNADLSEGFDFDKNILNVYANYLKQKSL